MEFMLIVLLLSLVLCISAVAVFRRRAWAWAVHDGQQPIIEIHDPTIARRALMDHADAFCNRPLNLFPVALVSGRRRSHSDNLTSVPYGPRWRALRCTLNAAVLHPSRLGHTDPLRLETMDALVADLRVRCVGGGGEIVVRDILNAAVFPLVARMCFGSGVDEGHVRAMRDLLQAFVLAVDGSKDFASSKTAKLLHWRQWRRFLAFRGKQAELFLPLVNARRNTNHHHLKLSGGLPAYLDHLLDARVPVDDDTADGKALRPLTDDELVSLLSEFLGAGPGTVVSSMEWTLAHLVLQPEVQSNIRREVDAVEGALSEARVRQMKYMHAVVLESLRLHPPIPDMAHGKLYQAPPGTYSTNIKELGLCTVCREPCGRHPANNTQVARPFAADGPETLMKVTRQSMRRIRLGDDETGRLLDILPPNNICIGVPFVTGLMNTNLMTKHVMWPSRLGCWSSKNEGRTLPIRIGVLREKFKPASGEAEIWFWRPFLQKLRR
uniref:Cytochrome P450 89A2 n=1 Tax=Aegilops tauschii TaxID=37682 RepID=M8AXB5_AEGTA